MAHGGAAPLRLVVAFVITTIAVSIVIAQRDGPDRTVDDPEAYVVYAAILPLEWPVRVAHAKSLVFQAETGTHSSCDPSGKILDEDWRPVVESYRRENTSSRTLLPMFPIDLPYEIVPRLTLGTSMRAGDWRPFYANYPDSGGFIEVSAVGFDKTHTRAMVYMAHHCGLLCGGGTHHLLERHDGRWLPADLDIQNCRWDS